MNYCQDTKRGNAYLIYLLLIKLRDGRHGRASNLKFNLLSMDNSSRSVGINKLINISKLQIYYTYEFSNS